MDCDRVPLIDDSADGVEKPPKDRLLSLLDQVEAHVERLRRETLLLEERRDSLFTTLDTIRNSELFSELQETDKEDIQKYLERVTTRCMTVEILVRTDRDEQQEEALFQVLIALIEKGLKYKTHFVNIANGEQYQDWFLKINPRGEVPVIQDGDNIVADSQRIIYYLEDKFTGESHNRLIPTDECAEVMDKHNHFHTIIHELPADVITIGSFYHTEFVQNPKLPFIYPVRRHMKTLGEKTLAKLKAMIENGHEAGETLKSKMEYLEKQEAIIKDKEEYRKVLEAVDKVLDEVEQQLWDNQGKPEKWLVCSRYTLADIGLTVLLERLSVLGLEERCCARARRPCLAGYWARVKQRHSYRSGTPSALFHIKTLLQGITYLSL